MCPVHCDRLECLQVFWQSCACIDVGREMNSDVIKYLFALNSSECGEVLKLKTLFSFHIILLSCVSNVQWYRGVRENVIVAF